MEQAYKGGDIDFSATLTMTCPVCDGNARRCSECKGTGRKEVLLACKADLPAGVDNGATVKATMRTVDPDLAEVLTPDIVMLARVAVAEHSQWRRACADLQARMQLRLDQFALGAAVSIDTPSGRLRVEIPPLSRPNMVLRVRGQGMPLPSTTRRGDLLIQLEPELPDQWTPEQVEAWERLRATYTQASSA